MTGGPRLAAGALALLLAAAAAAGPAPAQTLRVANNHEIPYRGPVRVAADLPDGSYGGAGDAAGVTADVRGGVARLVAALPAHASVVLTRRGAVREGPFAAGPLSVVPRPAGSAGGALDLRWNGRSIGTLELGLAVVPGTSATVDDATRAFAPLDLVWRALPDGTLRADATRDGYALELTLTPYGGGWLDARARLARAGADRGAAPAGPAYVALVRRLTTPGMRGARLRFNGRVFDGAASPDTWDRDFWYTRGVDWTSWTAGPLSIAAINGFTPAPTIQRGDGRWVEGSHFYVWERTRREGDGVYLVSELAGPNPGQEKSRYMPVTPYAPLTAGDTVDLKWRLALESHPAASWEESQLRVFAGYRGVRRDTAGAATSLVADLGVPHVTFGTSYFPYSTLTENFSFYRTPGLDKETFWAFSPTLWAKWRTLRPRMRGDLHIARAMGFELVRLHHLELLRQMDHAEAIAFLDWFTGEARALGLRVLIDSEGPVEWMGELAGRYRDVLTRVEVENEVLIGGIKPGDAERWRALYRVAKDSAPGADVFLTTAGNNGMFERLRRLGVPFDRVGLHAYKHGPQWKEAYASHVLGTAGYASDIGKPVTLGEFNWKELTKLSPVARRPEFAAVYENVLRPRAIPELIQFQLQESLSFNGAIAGSLTRHYETLAVDRRPKPEAFELMRLIRQYGPADSPVNVLPVAVREATLARGVATVPFTVDNRTGRRITVGLEALAFDGVASRLLSPARVTLRPGQRYEGRLALRLDSASLPGTYHHFVRASFADASGDGGEARTAIGWGVASNPGAPRFAAEPVLAGRVRYEGGAGIVGRLDWARPLAVAYGANASVLELETAYTVANTLQSATGRPVWLSTTADLPDSLRRDATLLLVGTPASNPLVARFGGFGAHAGAANGGAVAIPAATPHDAHGDPPVGVVALRRAGGRGAWLLLSGADKEGVQAAAIDVVLRYWTNAKDATIRLTGMERGAALGNRAGVGATELP